MKKMEYKAVSLKAAIGFGKGIEKFTDSITEQLNEISAELGADGWELATMFHAELAFCAVFKRAV